MACTPTPTATLFGTTLVPTFGLSTTVITQVSTVIVDGITIINPCTPTGTVTSTCAIASVISSISLVTSFITSVQTVSSVQTITSPTETLFSTSCPQQPQYPGQDTPITSSSSSTSTTVYVSPVTVTRTLTSTDPSGNIVLATVATVSTPSPNSTQSDAGSGGPNTPAIVGGVVGGLVGLAALIGIIWYIMYKKSSGRWDDIWEGDEAHQAGAAEVKQGPPVGDNGSSPNPYVYSVAGHGTPSPLLRTDQPSVVHSHSRSVSMATGHADHGRPNSQMSTTSPPHSPPTSPPSLQPSQLPGVRIPIWANPSAQQVQQGYPHIPSDTYSTTSTSRTILATASSSQGLLSGYAPTHTAATPAVAYPPEKVPLSQHQQTAASVGTTNLVDTPIDNSAKSPHRTSLVSVAPGPPKTSNPAPIVEDAPPPAYQQ